MIQILRFRIRGCHIKVCHKAACLFINFLDRDLGIRFRGNWQTCIGDLIKAAVNCYLSQIRIISGGIGFQILGKAPGRLLIKGFDREILHKFQLIRYMIILLTDDPRIIPDGLTGGRGKQQNQFIFLIHVNEVFEFQSYKERSIVPLFPFRNLCILNQTLSIYTPDFECHTAHFRPEPVNLK